MVPESVRLEAEQIRLLFASLPLGLVAGFFNAVIMVYVQRAFVADAVLATWFGLIALLTAARFGLLLAYRRADPPERIVARILRGLQPGAILLLHDAGVPVERMLAAVTLLIDKLEAQGYRCLRLDELIRLEEKT